MYTPAHFSEADPDEIERLISAHPLAAVVADTPGGLCANHLPLLRSGDKLTGHVALANDMHTEVQDGAPVLAIFRAEMPMSARTGIPANPRRTGRYRPGTIRWCISTDISAGCGRPLPSAGSSAS
ncbi:FMN-binding negative transcriptional regulator [Pannonibacter sp. Pt2-lr]